VSVGGRRLPAESFDRLRDAKRGLRGMILFTGYVGPRLKEGCALEWEWLDFTENELRFKVAKFDKPRQAW
jgi:hypothetical protein